MKRPGQLLPLGSHEPTTRALARLTRAWPLLVGPSLALSTRPLRVAQQVLVLGCSDLTRIGPFREATATAWPLLRSRIQRALGLELTSVQVVPCDPPQEGEAQQSQETDGLERLLRMLDARRRERIALGLEADAPGLPPSPVSSRVKPSSGRGSAW